MTDTTNEKENTGVHPDEIPTVNSAIDLNKVSMTLKALAVAFIPIIHLVTGVEIVSEQADKFIDAGIFITTTIFAAVGYIRSKRALQAQIYSLGGNIERTKLYAGRYRS